MQESLLCFSSSRGLFIPHYLDQRDVPWLSELIEVYKRFQNKPRKALSRYLNEPLPFFSPSRKRKLATYVLDGLTKDKRKSAVSPQVARRSLFIAGAKYSTLDRNAIAYKVASELEISLPELEQSLFADLPEEKLVSTVPVQLTPSELLLRANLALAQGLICRAIHIEVTMWGKSRPIVRYAKFKGLICEVKCTSTNRTKLQISGPYSLFRHTLIYGKALSELVPMLSWCNRFRLAAKCYLHDNVRILNLQSGDPIFSKKPPLQFDSKLEENFVRDLERITTDWDVIREPTPIQLLEKHIFPDFALQSRNDPLNVWTLEIVGFWTPEYIEKKLHDFRAANIAKLILCVDEQHICVKERLPTNAEILYFKKKINAKNVLDILENRV